MNARIHRPTFSRAHMGAQAQRGQSLVEMAIACIVIVPMFLGVMLLGQYTHIRQQTQAAARTAAWDAAVSPTIVNSAGGLPSQTIEQNRMQALQFGKADATLNNITAPSRLQDPMLTTFAGRDLVLARNVTLGTYTNAKSPALSETILGPLGQGSKAIGLGTFPPDNDGLITAEVHVKPEHITDSSGKPLAFLDPLDTMDLDFHGRTVLLADAWNADGAGENSDGQPQNDTLRSVRSAIKPLTPSEWAGNSIDGGIDKFMNILGDIPVIDQVLTPGWNDFRLGKTAPDVVPSDKLVRYGTTHP
ncbi:MAG TPA: TadE/TadG family type IV pilus assembly protein [Dyella sp.]|nr:TadE/TadG family type IV pilus assembly protein [Dyella sp.]